MLDWICVTITQALGSTPRNAGTRMWVSADQTKGTIGGGRMEWHAIAHARDMLADGNAYSTLTMALGPAAKQCCGGQVSLSFEASSQPQTVPSSQALKVFVYGKGHVGQALARASQDLPLQLVFVDSRAGYSADLTDYRDAIERAEPSDAHLVMTHDHGLDLDICAALIGSGPWAYFGLIGSKTKKARFDSQLRARNLDPSPIICPIGIPGIEGKEPPVIAAAVVAELLIVQSQLAKRDITP